MKVVLCAIGLGLITLPLLTLSFAFALRNIICVFYVLSIYTCTRACTHVYIAASYHSKKRSVYNQNFVDFVHFATEG